MNKKVFWTGCHLRLAIFMATCGHTNLQAQTDASRNNKPFSALRTGSHISVWLFNNFIFRNYELIRITATDMEIKNYEGPRQIALADIYHIRLGDDIYTAETATYNEIQPLEYATEYSEKYGDFIIDHTQTRTYGKITGISDTTLVIRTDEKSLTFPKSSVIKYRKDKELYSLSNKWVAPAWLIKWQPPALAKPVLGSLFANNTHLIEATAGIASPLNFYPQLNIGLQSNSGLPLYLGIRGGAAGPYTAAGWYYAQAQFFFGLNLPDIGFVKTALLFGYVYRNHMNMSPVTCNCTNGSTRNGSDFTVMRLAQKNFYAAFGFSFRQIFLEVGWEFKDYMSVSVTTPEVTNHGISAESVENIRKSRDHAESFARGVSDFSRFYFTVGYKLPIL